MGQALLIVKHEVTEYDKWRAVYEEVQPLRDKHHIEAQSVWQSPDNGGDVTVLHTFPTIADAQAFASDPELKDAMARAGVNAPPRLEIVAQA